MRAFLPITALAALLALVPAAGASCHGCVDPVLDLLRAFLP